MAKTTGGAAVAERPTDSVWLSTLPTIRRAPVAELVPAGTRCAGCGAGADQLERERDIVLVVATDARRDDRGAAFGPVRER